jgi:hypothetical protein
MIVAMLENKKIVRILVLLVIFCLPTISLLAQGFDDEVTDVPIDGGLSLLVAAGVGYGAKQLRKKKKDEKIMTDV